MNLIEHLEQVRDFRTQPRYPLSVILLLIIMGVMSGCTGYRALEDFVARHQKALLEVMDLPFKRLPCFSTLRRTMVRVDFKSMTNAFNAWAQDTFAVSAHEQVAVDGKSIRASVRDYDKAYQDFVSIVSAFSVQQGVVIGLEPMSNLGGSEIVTVQTLLDLLKLKGVCLSFDALHAQKKTLQQIIESGNDYIVAVKANQPTLLNELKTQFEQMMPFSIDTQVEQTRDRQTQRTVSVLDTIERIDPRWVGVQRIIRVERSGTRANQPYDETIFYISSLAMDAADFAQRIRDHWHIENCLHWPKDVVLKEDDSPVCDGYALINFAIVRTVAVNLFRKAGFKSVTKGLRHLAHDIPQLFSFFQ